MEDYSDIVYYERTEDTVDCFLKEEINTKLFRKYVVMDYMYVTKLQPLIYFKESRFDPSIAFTIFASDDGYLVFDNYYHLFTIYKSMEALKKVQFPNKIECGVDDFTKEPFIKAIMYGGEELGFPLGKIIIRIEYTNNKHRLIVNYNSSDLKITSKDTLHLLLEDGTILTFSNFTRPIKNVGIGKSMITSTIMTVQDIKSLATNKLVKWNLINDEGIVVVEGTFPFYYRHYSGLKSDIYKEMEQEVFQDFFASYLSLYDEIRGDEDYKVDDEAENEDVTQSSSTCYVYLMVDTTNNFHKIGISNNPKYREHTLQSDKPTIELLCAKEYPSRAIAEAFESALHRVYSSKRIRGEWFKLDPSDIEEIKQTLK
jgi:hypothetical protein